MERAWRRGELIVGSIAIAIAFPLHFGIWVLIWKGRRAGESIDDCPLRITWRPRVSNFRIPRTHVETRQCQRIQLASHPKQPDPSYLPVNLFPSDSNGQITTTTTKLECCQNKLVARMLASNFLLFWLFALFSKYFWRFVFCLFFPTWKRNKTSGFLIYMPFFSNR